MDTTLHDPLVGQVLDGRYRVDARIAVGGMATVYRAVDTRLDRVLALKVMHPGLAADASFVERFIREAKSVARLAHPNVVGVFDQGAQDQYVYLAMEYIAGCTLRDVLRERGALQPRAALDILEPVLAALGAAHRAGFVHRDMKPENVLIGDDGRVKVADFGLVRAVDSVTSSTGSILGTVSYLAPEQIEHGTADTRADVYACGVVLYEMLTGTKPHGGETPAQILYAHLHEGMPAPSAAVPGLALELDELVAAATARNPDVRPDDAVALLALARTARAALDEEQLDAVPPGAHSMAAGAGADDRTSVIPRAVPTPVTPAGVPLPAESAGADPVVNRTSRLIMPQRVEEEPERRPVPRGPRDRFGNRRGLIAVVTALLLIVGVGAGVWYINSGQFTRVPALIGQSEDAAKRKLDGAGLDLKKVDRQFSDTVERGQVISTDPATGARIRGNGSVTLVVSRGPETAPVPKLDGMPLAQARSELQKAGFAPGDTTSEFSDGVAQGAVIRTDPPAGVKRHTDSAVALVVSKGAPVDTPSVVGDSVADATAALQGAGLKVAVSPDQVDSQQEAGKVAAQSAPEHARLTKGDTVTLTVSKGPRMVPVPTVTGQKADDAQKALEAAGFKVKVDRGFPFLSDEVSGQSVAGGTPAPEGSTITITTKGL
ncbi:Stk1 family PASTA domain-containing Ser/Thr kinase [Streptomyces sp. NBC_00083]|uniref:Stk1 family PASTA domain-containing Ser/Thr kinase n=1 Tax=Streptomyces sp. NBC_00083 TaxID=2975647 RepID=UPI0022590507|nr:Stk1 family PASTA domain-containing Ser/Thr kinase [Streptomyces sp. NBC_00083]MCX5382940.1 Stk1 family PASTA domain-containing Ser/Thr kinase [Streptomyces sp. NBC_00083]